MGDGNRGRSPIPHPLSPISQPLAERIVFELIKALTELTGPVGQEGEVLDYIEPLWQAAGAETERTRIGNLVARAGGRGRKLLLAAHADELCYLVRAIAPGGFLYLANGQAWERKTSLRNWFA